MDYGINILSVLPVRAEPDHRSEMVNQLLFGEQYTVIEETSDWIYIQGALDGYKGWIANETSILVNKAPSTGNPNSTEVISQAVKINQIDNPGSSRLILPGSTLPDLNPSNGEFMIEGVKYIAHANLIDEIECTPHKLAQTALIFLNSPYLWGGRSMFGIDCSGLVQVIYKICGIALPRDARQQVKEGSARDFASEAQPGDLAFFANPDEEISHVGMILEPGKIIHASGKVRIDNFDHQGIFHLEKKNYSHTLRVIHSYLSPQ